MHRGYHNLTARYNGYYYATESIKEAELKIRSSYKYDYDRLLPVYLIPSNETAKNTFPEFDKAIKKSSNCIQRHTIKDKKGNEIPTAGKWIDNNWNVIGISHYYKREFFSGIEAFEYVVRTYKSKDKYKSMYWLARSYMEIGSVTQAEPIISLLKEDKKLPKQSKKLLPALRADYLIRRGLFAEAEQELIKAIKNKPSRRDKARYSFILAQMSEQQNNKKRAIQYYQKVIDAKPEYDLVFHAKMKRARLFDSKSGNLTKLKKELIAMTRDIKNKEYLDEIYYTLGEIHEKEKNETQAINSYNLSIRNSTQNPKQKALSYLKLGEIYFEDAQYVKSGAYYDSTMITLPKDYFDYENISKRKQILETLVGYILTIQREDSLQKIAAMSDKNRILFIENMIKKLKEDEDKKKEELEALQNQNSNPNYNPNNNDPNLLNMTGGTKGDWYFYNQTTLSFGVNDFVKKWGGRKLEDNWRRSQKALAIEESSTPSTKDSLVTNSTGKNSDTKMNPIEPYLKDLPLNDSLLKLSDSKIIDAYYNLASTYKDDLNNNKKSIFTFEELNNRYPNHKYRASSYYKLNRIYVSTKNQSKADEYKNKLLNEFPKSEYAQLINNPNYAVDKKSQKGEVELFYSETYETFSSNQYQLAFSKCSEAESKFGKNDFSGKFAYIKAMCVGKLKGIDSLELALKQVQVLYPKDAVIPQVQSVLEVIYNIKHPSETGNPMQYVDTFLLDLNAPHIVMAIYPDDAAMSESFKNSLSDFNTDFYGISDLTFTSSLFGGASQIVTVKSFKNAEEAMKYIKNLSADTKVFSGKVKKEQFTLMAIASDNFPRFFKKKSIDYYKPFYEDHYK
jgi:tetratricopeptide (TPR) repeat protein